MEKYRAAEKDSKTKKHTKEGAVIYPEDKRKTESRNWIQKCIDELQLHTEQIESEILRTKVVFYEIFSNMDKYVLGWRMLEGGSFLSGCMRSKRKGRQKTLK